MNERPCPQCERQNPLDARFCGECGYDVGGVSEPHGHEAIADPLIGRTIADRYRIIEMLGRGGMGVVYKVEHVHIGKLMAMKLLHGELARDRDTMKRFRREAEAASRLSHSNTVQVFDFGSSDGLMYLVMEFVEGRDFSNVIREQGGLEFARVARLCAQVCASVAEAHGNGVVHRNLKPENVMVVNRSSGGETAKVLDFGLAKLREGNNSVTVTRQGAIVGTPYYMSPEQIRGEEVDARGDVYAIGAMMYKACTGQPPFSASTPMGVLTKHLTEDLVPPSERSPRPLPPVADEIIMHAMEKDRRNRYQSAEELRADLVDYLVSTGAELSDPDFSVSTVSGRASAAISSGRRQEPLATRRDVDGYERNLRAKGIAGYMGGLVVLAACIIGAVFGYRHLVAANATPTAEVEPNNDPATASPLPRDVELTGRLGQRQSADEGDVDFYLLSRSGSGRQRIDVHVGALPNMDLVVELVRAGNTSPAVSVDTAGVGRPEWLVGFPVADDDYLVRVRESVPAGALPTENISDDYTILWQLTTPEPDEEVEVNDSLEIAGDIGIGGVIRGRIGWRGDADVYCLSGSASSVTAAVSGVPGVDIVLRVVDQAAHTSRKIDENGVGEGEASAAVEGVRGDTCFEVSADAHEPGEGVRPANARDTYTLEITAGVDG